MKKFITILFCIFLVIGCNQSKQKINVVNKPKLNTYEILLSTKDTIFIEAKGYTTYSGFFGNSETIIYDFYDEHFNDFQEIRNPVYVKQLIK